MVGLCMYKLNYLPSSIYSGSKNKSPSTFSFSSYKSTTTHQQFENEEEESINFSKTSSCPEEINENKSKNTTYPHRRVPEHGTFIKPDVTLDFFS